MPSAALCGRFGIFERLGVMHIRYCRRIVFLACAALLILAAPGQVVDAFAEKAAVVPVGPPKTPDDLDLIDVGTVKEIKQSDMIVLDNGKTYHMDQIRIPVYYDDTALAYLHSNVLNKKVGVYALKNAKIGATDRYGNFFGHILREDGTWIQADMVARGLAWAYSTESNRTLIHPLYKYEAAARADKVGFWKDPEFVIKTKNNIAKYVNSYQIYQGVIVARSWGTDKVIFICDPLSRTATAFTFTIRLDRSINFVRPGTRPDETFATWRGAYVRVRGWVDKDTTNAVPIPTIDVTHPEQMEFLDPATGEPTTKYE
jgi:hypothetical protein